MKIFVAGASGAIGARLVPALVQHGHEVVGTTRTPAKTERLRQLGAEPVVLDAFDEVAVKDAVATASPEVVVHELTDIPDAIDPRNSTSSSPPPTGCAPRAWIICWRRRAPPVSGGSSRRASARGSTHGPAAR